MTGPLEGRAHLFGDHVDTDGIIPARFCLTLDPAELGQHAMAGVDEGFAARVAKGDFIVAGENFGCGSSRETAPVALLGAGVGAVVACSFARIFLRNAINVGLPIFECPEAARACRPGDRLRALATGGLLENLDLGERYPFHPWPTEVAAIVAAGGLVPYVRLRLGLPPESGR